MTEKSVVLLTLAGYVSTPCQSTHAATQHFPLNPAYAGCFCGTALLRRGRQSGI